jgi:hypothetical protein
MVVLSLHVDGFDLQLASSRQAVPGCTVLANTALLPESSTNLLQCLSTIHAKQGLCVAACAAGLLCPTIPHALGVSKPVTFVGDFRVTHWLIKVQENYIMMTRKRNSKRLIHSPSPTGYAMTLVPLGQYSLSLP